MKFPKWHRLIAVLFAASLSLAVAQDFTTWKQCKLIPTEWADGDSFQIQTPNGEMHTIRLYGADCIEWHVSDDSDARGDGKFKRIYAFVTTAEGEDLAERLVRLGLARAFGVYRETPAGKSANDYRAYLQDVELQAAKRGVGAWAKTNWDLLLTERQAERQENDELAMAAGNAKLAPGAKINPNTAPQHRSPR